VRISCAVFKGGRGGGKKREKEGKKGGGREYVNQYFFTLKTRTGCKDVAALG